jgi:hypothetical protein
MRREYIKTQLLREMVYVCKQRKILRNSCSNMPNIQKAPFEKGKAMIVYGGFAYTLKRATEIELIFRCKNRSSYINVATNRL